MEFHNPYAFIEATGRVNGTPSTVLDFADIVSGIDPYVRHDYWHEKALSGRLLYCLETQSPLVIGKEQVGDDNEAKQVLPYTVKEELAIPANSLRGLIGNNAEALSQSALRVMTEQRYSVRQRVGQTPMALGMLVKCENSESGWAIRPLLLPALSSRSREFNIPHNWQKIFGKRLIWQEYLGAYLTFSKGSEPASYTPDNKQYYYAQLSDKTQHAERYIDSSDDELLKVKRNFLLGQKCRVAANKELITKLEYKGLSEFEKRKYTRGILRVFGSDHDSIPGTKYHELFIPYPETAEKRQLCPVGQQVITDFKSIAKERHQAQEHLPFRLKGYEGAKHELNDGDLLYFSIDNSGDVAHLSVSQIWRQSVPGSLFDSFNNIDEKLLPLAKNRSYLTAAECLFGVVAEVKEEGEKQAMHLASRVRFFDAKALKAVELNDEAMLRILASPKAPSPAMYFHQQGDQSATIPKQKLDLTSPLYQPNGRKRYIPHRQQDIDNEFWATKDGKDPHLRLKVKPIPAQKKFYFHVDVENISPAELSLLRAAMTPEQFESGFEGNYQHRLGLGKPLGLGHVSIKPVGVFLVDRNARYQPLSVFKPRYQQCWLNADMQWPDALKEKYRSEWQSANHAEAGQIPAWDASLVDSETLSQMLTVGDSTQVQFPVRYPFMDTRSDAEQEGFEWFVENDKPKTQVQSLNRLSKALNVFESSVKNKYQHFNNRKPNRLATLSGNNEGFKQGRIKFYNQEKGFGFIVPEGSGKDIFIHCSVLKQSGYENVKLNPNDIVLFKQEMGKKGPQVSQIKLVE